MADLVEVNWTEMGLPGPPQNPSGPFEKWLSDVLFILLKSTKKMELNIQYLPCKEEADERNKMSGRLKAVEVQTRVAAEGIGKLTAAQNTTHLIWRSYGAAFKIGCSVIGAAGGILWILVQLAELRLLGRG